MKLLVIDMGYWTRVIKNLLLLVISLVVIFASFKLAIFYIPFLIGFIISVLIEPIIKGVSKITKWNRKTSAIIIVLLIFTIIIGLITWGIISIVTESSNLLSGLNSYVEKIYNQIQKYITKLETNNIEIPEQLISLLENGAVDILQTISKHTANILTNVLQKVTLIPITFVYIIITVLSTYFICTDKFYILDQMEHHFPKLWVKKFGSEVRKILNSLGNYLKAEVIMIFISFLIILTGLGIGRICGLNIEYPLLSALRHSLCRCTSNFRSRNGHDTLGNNFSI